MCKSAESNQDRYLLPYYMKHTDIQWLTIKSYPAKPENDSIVLTVFLVPDHYNYDWMQQDSEALSYSEKAFRFCLWERKEYFVQQQ